MPKMSLSVTCNLMNKRGLLCLYLKSHFNYCITNNKYISHRDQLHKYIIYNHYFMLSVHKIKSYFSPITISHHWVNSCVPQITLQVVNTIKTFDLNNIEIECLLEQR